MTPLPRNSAKIQGLEVWENAPLPKLPTIFCGIYVREGADSEDREQVADAIVAALHPGAGPALRDGHARGAFAASPVA